MRNPKWNRDEIILALALYFDKERGPIDNTNPKVIELSETLNQLPIFAIKPDQEKFRNPNGVALKLSNFIAIDPTHSGRGMGSYSKLDREVFEEFQNDHSLLRKLANEIKTVVSNSALKRQLAYVENDETAEIDSVKEGQILYRLHKVRERDRKIIEAKKTRALKDKGKLECEACGFDFEATYGVLGKGFIECHHIVPLHEFDAIKETKIEDLALVCSNCHRILHRGGHKMGINDLRSSLKGFSF